MKELSIKPSEKILILSPHPDDESIACGGLILKYHSQCSVLFLTDGCLGNPEWSMEKTKNIRYVEALKAMNFAKVEKFDMLNCKDGSLKKYGDIFAKIDFSGYDYIFCPHPQDNHSDHRAVSHLLSQANISSQTQIFYYEVWTPMKAPTHYIDISNIVTQKRKLISFYKSQLKYVNYSSRIIALNHYRGLFPSIKYAEAYTRRRYTNNL